MNTTVKTGPRRGPGQVAAGQAQPRSRRPGGPARPVHPARPGARAAAGPAARASAAADQAVRAPAAARTVQARPAGVAPGAAVAGRRPVSRTPFILLLVGLLGGGLICLLVINTTLAAASFRINALQQSNAQAAQRAQALQQQVATEESPGSIEQRAERLGMQMQSVMDFVDLRTGRRYTTPAQVPGVTAVPGYTP
jgi:hypothetical protein